MVFRPGQSGNPNGRPRGSKNRRTQIVEQIIGGAAEDLARQAVDMAMAGDPTALRICLNYVLPARKDRPICIDLPKITGPQDLPAAMWELLVAVARGELTPAEAVTLAGLLAEYRKTLEFTDLEARITAIEERLRERTWD